MIDWITQTSNPPEDRVLNQNLGRRARQPDTPRKQRSPKPFRSALGSARLQIRSRLGSLGQALLSRGETSALGMIDRPPSGQSSGSEPVGSAPQPARSRLKRGPPAQFAGPSGSSQIFIPSGSAPAPTTTFKDTKPPRESSTRTQLTGAGIRPCRYSQG